METQLIQAIGNIANSIDALAQPRLIDWLAVVLSFFSVVLSVVAIWFAVQIPKKIADRQDKISIFDMRMQCYRHLQKHFNFCEVISPKKSPVEVFEWAFMDCLHKVEDNEEMLMILNEVRNSLYQIPFLFTDIEENEIDQIYISFLHLTNKILANEKFSDELQHYQEVIHNFQQKHLKNIRMSLMLY